MRRRRAPARPLHRVARMAPSSDSCALPSRAHRMAQRAAHGACVASAAFVLACASGEAGDPCWSYDECTSGSCSSGTCDSDGLLELLAAIVEAAETEPVHEEPAATFRQEPGCEGLDERTCNATASCIARVTCFPSGSCLGAPTDDFFNHPRTPEARAFLEGELPWTVSSRA